MGFPVPKKNLFHPTLTSKVQSTVLYCMYEYTVFQQSNMLLIFSREKGNFFSIDRNELHIGIWNEIPL